VDNNNLLILLLLDLGLEGLHKPLLIACQGLHNKNNDGALIDDKALEESF